MFGFNLLMQISLKYNEIQCISCNSMFLCTDKNGAIDKSTNKTRNISLLVQIWLSFEVQPYFSVNVTWLLKLQNKHSHSVRLEFIDDYKCLRPECLLSNNSWLIDCIGFVFVASFFVGPVIPTIQKVNNCKKNGCGLDWNDFNTCFDWQSRTGFENYHWIFTISKR